MRKLVDEVEVVGVEVVDVAEMGTPDEVVDIGMVDTIVVVCEGSRVEVIVEEIVLPT